jgi:hypothetical protein
MRNPNFMEEIGTHWCDPKRGQHYVGTQRCEACGGARNLNDTVVKTVMEPGSAGGVPLMPKAVAELASPAYDALRKEVADDHEALTFHTLPETLTDTLAARGNRYGKFTGHAEVTQTLKMIVATALTKRNKTLAPDQQEALDMICHKIGRIINGDENYDDSWIDIAGYAQLVADRLRGTER